MSEDEQARELRERLDRELAEVRSDPSALREVLVRGRAEPARRATPSPWLVAAAAALVVAVAAPVLATTVLHGGGGSGGSSGRSGGSGPAEHLAGPAGPPLPAVSTAPTTPRPTALPPRRPSATPVPVPVPVPPAPSASGSPRSSARPSRGATVPAAPPSSPATGCAPVPSVPGAAAGPAVTADVDGDGTRDTLSVDGSTLVARLSSGGAASAALRAVSGELAVLPVETDGSRGTELLLLTRGAAADDGTVGRRGTLYDLRSCALVPVTNAQGAPYVFRVGGDATGTALSGISCDSGVLVGLTSVRQPDGSWRVTHTPVTSGADGRATNGRPTVLTVAGDDPQQPALSEASCGSQQPLSLG